MQVGLFIPCYIDQFYPQVGVATLCLLEDAGCEVIYPIDQTCCGQPMANTGCESDSIETARLFVANLRKFDYITAPSASCVYHVKKHYDMLPQSSEVEHVRKNIYDVTQLLHEFLKPDLSSVSFPHKVGIHQSCHGLRGLGLGNPSELMDDHEDIISDLLSRVSDIQLIDLSRPDECCGFGGTFSINEEAVSYRMGRDRLQDHIDHGVEFITSADMSCLMHLDGIIRREKLPLKVLHITEILAGTYEPSLSS